MLGFLPRAWPLALCRAHRCLFRGGWWAGCAVSPPTKDIVSPNALTDGGDTQHEVEHVGPFEATTEDGQSIIIQDMASARSFKNSVLSASLLGRCGVSFLFIFKDNLPNNGRNCTLPVGKLRLSRRAGPCPGCTCHVEIRGATACQGVPDAKLESRTYEHDAEDLAGEGGGVPRGPHH